jgi:hypothetical protein
MLLPLARDVVGRHTVVRQVNDRVLPSTASKLASVIAKGLANAFNIIKQPDLSADKLTNPDGHRVGAVPGAADVEERLNRQHWIERNVTDPAILSCLLQMSGEVGPLERLGNRQNPDLCRSQRAEALLRDRRFAGEDRAVREFPIS